MKFSTSVQAGLKKTFVFKGRACRSEYWWFQLFLLLMTASVVIVEEVAVEIFEGNYALTTELAHLMLLFPYFSSTCRRLHDIGKSGWWIVLIFVYSAMYSHILGEEVFAPEEKWLLQLFAYLEAIEGERIFTEGWLVAFPIAIWWASKLWVNERWYLMLFVVFIAFPLIISAANGFIESFGSNTGVVSGIFGLIILVVFIVWLCLKGDQDSNKYGDSVPKKSPDQI